MVVLVTLIFMGLCLSHVSNATVQISSFSLADSVVITTEPTGICIPKHYYFLRGRFMYGQTISKLTWMLTAVLNELGKYGSAYESDEMQAKRICTTAVKAGKTYCPLTAVTALTGEAKTLRHSILEDIARVEYELERIVNIWNILPNEYKSPDPAYTSEAIENTTRWTSELNDSKNMPSQDRSDGKPPPTIYYPYLNDKIVAALDLVPSLFRPADKTLVIPKDDTKLATPNDDHQFIGGLAIISMAIEQAYHMLQKIHHTSLDMMKGQFPEDLFPINHWIYHWFNIPVDNLSDEEKVKLEGIVNMLRGLPLTMVKKSNCDPVYVPRHINESCTLDMVTMIPDLDTMLQYEEMKLTPHPVKNALGKWIKVKIPADKVLFHDVKSKKGYLTTTRKSLNCFKDAHISKCHMCTSDTALRKVSDTCIKAIINRSVTKDDCSVEETAPDSFQRIPKVTIVTQAPPTDDHVPTTTEKLTAQIILSNDKPSAIIERCPDGETSHDLPHSAKIAISEKCKISFINPPKVVEVIPGQDFPHIPIPTHTALTRDGETRMEHSYHMLKVHFHEHGYIYILVSTTSLFMLIVIHLSCIVVRRTKRTHKRRREQEMLSLITRPNTTRALAIPQGLAISELEE
jgi:hypothetical protein